MRFLTVILILLAMAATDGSANARFSRGAPAVSHSAPMVRAAPAQHFRTSVQPAYRAPAAHHSVSHSIASIRATHENLSNGYSHQSPSETIHHGPTVMTPPAGRRQRPITRQVVFHGGLLAIPAVVAFGVPVLLEVPGIGSVSVAEDRYRELYELLTSENAADSERAYTELKQIKLSEPSTDPIDGPPVAPTNMLPPGFKAGAPRAVSGARDLAEPLSFDGPPPKRNDDGRLW
jgi:hypothetical protein